jgi:transcriptional regulator with XRE-family HTH domain
VTGSTAIGSNFTSIVRDGVPIVNTSGSITTDMLEISTDYATTLGDYVRYLRLQRGLTQMQLHDAVDISQRTISDIERGKTAFSRLSNFRKLATFFGVPIEELVLRAGLADSRSGAARFSDALIPASSDDDPHDVRLRAEAMKLINSMTGAHLEHVVSSIRLMAQAPSGPQRRRPSPRQSSPRQKD